MAIGQIRAKDRTVEHILFDSAILRILPQGNNQKCVQGSTYMNFRYSNSVS